MSSIKPEYTAAPSDKISGQERDAIPISQEPCDYALVIVDHTGAGNAISIHKETM